MGRVELTVHDDGPRDAPALVLGGSLGSTSGIWDAMMPELARSFRVVRYEHWGHGGSAIPSEVGTVSALAEDVLGLLDAMGIGRFHVAGVSLGGMVALWLAAHHASRVDRVCLICTAPRLVARQNFAERAKLVRDQGMAAVAEAVVDRWLTPSYAATRPALVTQLRAMVSSVEPAGYASCCEAIASWDCMDALPAITAPTLVVGGAKDAGISPTYSVLLAESIAGAQLLLVQAAHVPCLEQPAALGKAMAAHLLGEEPEASASAASGSATPEEDRRVEAGQGVQDSLAARREQGEAVRRAVLGDAHVERAKANASPLTAPFQDLLMWYPWGSIWARPGLSRGERSMITLALLAALHHEEELAMHVRAALRNGLSPAQIREVLLHTGVYAGIPAANRAFVIAQRVLAETGHPLAAAGPGPTSDT